MVTRIIVGAKLPLTGGGDVALGLAVRGVIVGDGMVVEVGNKVGVAIKDGVGLEVGEEIGLEVAVGVGVFV